jgi:hypothetical protein
MHRRGTRERARRGIGKRDDTVGVGHERDHWRARGRRGGARVGGRHRQDLGRAGTRASRGGWVGRPARRLV